MHKFGVKQYVKTQKMKRRPKHMKLNYRKTFAIGLGFFTVSLVWAIYNVAVPLYLDNLGLSGTSVGIVMTIDNVFALLFLPIFGTLSDRTRTRYGKRMPYLLIGIPLSAIAFFIIPFSIKSLIFLMTSVIALNFFMSIYRAPTVALMPDVTPRPLRSKANGIINFMGGFGSVVAFFLSGVLFNIAEFVPYASVSIIMIITIILMFNLVKEPETISSEKEENSEHGESPLDSNEKGKLLSLIFLLTAIFFWFTGFNAVETFFSTYGQKILGIGKSDSSFLLAIFSASFLVFCIPAGLVAGKLGRKRTIMTGLVILLSAFISLIFSFAIVPVYIGMWGTTLRADNVFRNRKTTFVARNWL
jgi:maltose/moltooligosaccharide transporter